MRLPLLVAGKPNDNCCLVRVPQGKWKLLVSGIKDSIIKNPVELFLSEPTILKLEFSHIGTESNLTVYLEQQ